MLNFLTTNVYTQAFKQLKPGVFIYSFPTQNINIMEKDNVVFIIHNLPMFNAT